MWHAASGRRQLLRLFLLTCASSSMGLQAGRPLSMSDLKTSMDDEMEDTDRLHRCSFEGCESSFQTAARLKKHNMIHAERVCGHFLISFLNSISFCQRVFICERDDCAKSFRLKSHLERHRKTPHEKVTRPKKTYPCSFCDKVCKSKFDLRVHEAVHTGNKPLKCDVCDATFAKKDRLNAHMKTHHTYSCAFPDCHFEADKWSLLRKHLPVHNIKCPLCSSKFKTQESLDKHVASHTITFKCSQCDLQYAKQSGLKAHIRAVHQKVTFRCLVDGCEKEFAFKQSLRHHVKTHADPAPKKRQPSLTIKRVVTAATLSGHEPSEDEKLEMLSQDKEFRKTNQSDIGNMSVHVT